MAPGVRPITRDEHRRFVASRSSVSFLQCPSWGDVKAEWRAESLGWVDGDRIVGAGLVLYRRVPRLRRYLAYLPEGPVLDWSAPDAADWLAPMVAHVERRGAFGIRMGPPVATRAWEAGTVKGAIAARVSGLPAVPADWSSPYADALADRMRGLGWRAPARDGGFSAGQPRYVFQLPLAGKDEDELLKGFNQQWRRNLRKADRAGVVVTRGGYDDLPAFHRLYTVTAARDGFTPRGLGYFQTMWRAMRAEDEDRLRLYLARHGDRLLAATTLVRVGDHAWYSYGASSDEGREVRPSNAVQWRMMRDALAAGAEVYDLRGISDTLAEDDKLFGLLQFKLGTGGRAVEYLGEWDLPLNRALHAAFRLYLSRQRTDQD